MKKMILLITLIFLSLSCKNLNQLKTDITPEQWLESHSHIVIHNIILSEPSSSIIVFLLGILLITAGIKVIKGDRTGTAVMLWSSGLILWGISTFFAGISYQLFSFMLKFHGRELSLWTTWWEIWYLLTFVIGQNLIIAGTAEHSLEKGPIKFFRRYTVINTVIYSIVLFTGAFIPNQFMVSFELMILFIGPTFLLLFIFNIMEIRGERSSQNKIYAALWIGMGVVIILYFAMLSSPIPELLWKRGIWFNANDTLHTGLIVWIVLFINKIDHLYRNHHSFPMNRSINR